MIRASTAPTPCRRPSPRASRRTHNSQSTSRRSRFAPRAGSGCIAGFRSQVLVYLARAMAVKVRFFTDPVCPWSWAAEPAVRRLMVEFGDSLSWTYVMGGFARDFAKWHEEPGARVGGMD